VAESCSRDFNFMTKSLAKQKEYRDRRTAAGICVACGGLLSRKTVICASCQETRNTYRRTRRADRKKKGLCPECGEVAPNGRTYCLDCVFLHRLDLLKLSPEETERAVKAWNSFQGACECCGTTQPPKRGWFMDHDHKAKKFRGIICQFCNTGLGYFFDDVTKLHAAIEYIKRSQNRA